MKGEVRKMGAADEDSPKINGPSVTTITIGEEYRFQQVTGYAIATTITAYHLYHNRNGFEGNDLWIPLSKHFDKLVLSGIIGWICWPIVIPTGVGVLLGILQRR